MRYVVSCLLVLIACWETYAQLPTLTFEHLTTKDGLPSNEVWCITKDKAGFLWISTGRSICRYDGYTFQLIDNQALGYSSGVSADSAGIVYASISTKGLCRVNPKTLTLETILENNYTDTDRTNDMHDRVFVDSFNQIWTCDLTSVKRYDPARKKHRGYILSSAMNIHQDATFFEDSQRRLWIISEIGLYRYDRQRDQLTCLLGLEAPQGPNKRPARLEMAFEDAQGDIWLGAYDTGLIRFSPSTGRSRTGGSPKGAVRRGGSGDQSFLFLAKGFENQNVICGQESVDANGRQLLFIGTEKGLILYYPDQKKVYYPPEFRNKGIHVKAMYDDKDNGILWIGTRKGLFKYRYRNPGIHTIDIPASAVRLEVEVTSPLQLPGGQYLLGLSHSGALHWQPATNQFRLWPYPVSAYTYQLRWIHNRPVAFTDKGVFVGNPAKGSFSRLPAASRLFTSVEFRDGLLDRRGRFWIANLTQGLKVIDPVTDTAYKLWPDSVGQQLVRNNYIKTISEGTDGKIWVATCPNGLYYFDEDRAAFINIRNLPVNKGKELSGLCINGLQRSYKGSMLVATWGGVNKISATGAIVVSFDYQHDKLNDTYCSNVCEDDLGNLWFSTNEGIHIANPKTRKIKYLTTIEGLNSNYPVGFLRQGANKLILGHVNALNVLDLNALVHTKVIPRIAISSVEVKGKRLHQDLTQPIVLQPDENAITLNFSTLNFEPASKNMFSYQLEGYEPNWVDLGNQHTVSFTNLPARAYTLRVRSSNNFGIQTTTPLLLQVTVKPYFTNTWFFKTLVGLFIAGLLVAMMRWRVNTLAERNRLDLQVAQWRLKALQAQMNPHFLFNSLNSVQNYLLTNRGLE
ncbi:ligand-binding sensor domain-containing protein, partial [Spirosoma areae]